MDDLYLKNIQQRFAKKGGQNPKLVAAFHTLQAHLNVKQTQSFYNGFSMTGYLKKMGTSKIFFQLFKRYFEIDYYGATITITHSKDNKDGLHVIPFRDCVSSEVTFLRTDKCNEFKYPFNLKTKEKEWVLYAPSVQERAMWVDGLTYVILSTEIVQQLMVEESPRIAVQNEKRHQRQVTMWEKLPNKEKREKNIEEKKIGHRRASSALNGNQKIDEMSKQQKKLKAEYQLQNQRDKEDQDKLKSLEFETAKKQQRAETQERQIIKKEDDFKNNEQGSIPFAKPTVPKLNLSATQNVGPQIHEVAISINQSDIESKLEQTKKLEGQLEQKKEEIKKLMKGKIKIKLMTSNRSNGNTSLPRNSRMTPQNSNSFVGQNVQLSTSNQSFNLGQTQGLSFLDRQEEDSATVIQPQKQRNLSLNPNAGRGSIWKNKKPPIDRSVNQDLDQNTTDSLKSKLLFNKRKLLKLNPGALENQLNRTQQIESNLDDVKVEDL